MFTSTILSGRMQTLVEGKPLRVKPEPVARENGLRRKINKSSMSATLPVPNKPCSYVKGPKKAVLGVQRNVENRPSYESFVHNMTFESNKMSLP